ncbi:JAB domain-containing protein [archaeon]|jgi:DNA repair protein RadC|nr:JAB domain-containing protein [archaeon]NCP79464.1 JAB domain-containing protein [archaeon]NCP97407.1 JAB domain-containing protein [archaeon]NCQ07231.1 JAB domain-containing protein [archaeon]NCQ51027.1 JAB domain-containing protein [archaeon]
MRLKDIAPENRPLERLSRDGEKSLSNSELLAIILKTGTKEYNVLDISNQILSRYTFQDLENISINQLLKIKGIGIVKASQIKAIIELYKRISIKNIKTSEKIYSPKTAYEILRHDIENKEQEHLITLFLKGNEVISKKIITIGTDNQTLVSEKEILKEALKENAQAIIIAHNHPSGECYPSREDKIATTKIKEACKLLEITFLDHLIITNQKYFSFKENNLI